VNFAIQASDAMANVQARLSIDCSGNNSVRKSELQLKQLHLVEPPGFSTQAADVSEIRNGLITTEEGFRWLHLSQQPGKHSVSLVGKSLVTHSADRYTLNLDLPLASSTVDVELPANAVEERVRNDDLIESRLREQDGVKLKIRTRGGNFSISWRTAVGQAKVAAVEAKCDTLFEPTDLLDPAQFWTATSTISLRWYGTQAAEKIRIILPEGAQWSSLPYSEPDRFSITSVMPTDEGAAETSVEIVEVENLDTTDYPAIENLKLQWRWLPKHQQVDQFVNRLTVAVPKIEGVDAHDGSIELVFPNSFHAAYQEGPGVRFVQLSPAANLLARNQIQFQYKGSDASLQIAFRKEQYQPTIRPLYHVHFHKDRLQLTGWIKCAADSPSVELGLIPGSWTFDEDSACRLIDLDVPNSDETAPLAVKRLEDGTFILSAPDGQSGSSERRVEHVWRFEAWQDWKTDAAGQVEVQLPRIDRGRALGQVLVDHGSGSILLSSDNSLLLQADDGSSIGLLRDVVSGEVAPYVNSQYRQPLHYRFQRNSQPPLWKGRVNVLQQKVAVTQESVLTVKPKRILIEQDFQLAVSNRPLTELRVRVRNDASAVTAQLGEFALSFEPEVEQESSSDWKTFLLAGLPEVIGDVKLKIVTAYPWQFGSSPAGITEAPTVESVSLDIPVVNLVFDTALQTQLGQFRWAVEENLEIRSHNMLMRNLDAQFEIGPEQSSIPVEILNGLKFGTLEGSAKEVWLQSLYNGAERRDRFVVRLQSARKEVTIQLPDQTQLEKVALDQQQLSSETVRYEFGNRTVLVTLPDDKEHTLEVLYSMPASLAWANHLQFTPAKLLDIKTTNQFYWQIVTPSIYHLAWCPRELSADWEWRWSDFAWRRISVEDQSSLEKRLSAAALPRIPASTNSYVMTSYGEFPLVEVWILSRFVIWLPVGSLAIILTLLILNVGWVRSPTCMLLFCAGLATMSLTWPDLSILMGQAALASFTLSAVIWITQSAVNAKVRRRSVFTTRPATATDISDQILNSRSVRSTGSASKPSTVGVD
jgi:hypothetical protein